MTKGKASRFIVASLALGVMISSANMAYAINYSDIQGHWAYNSIEKLSNYGLIAGYEGKFRPNDSITRGELAVIIDRVMGYTTESRTRFSDLDNEFYKQPILRANNAGIISGYGDMVRPKDPITREEAAAMLSRAFHLTDGSLPSGKFKDNSLISDWARGSVGTLANKGFITGDNKGNFNPKANITRGEVTSILDRMMAGYINKSGTYTSSIEGNAVINTSGVELKDLTVSGDLIISEGVKDGDVTLNNTNVKGTVYVLGGGSKSIKIKGNSSIPNIESSKKDSDIRYDVANSSKVNTLNIRDGKKVIVEGTVQNITSYNEKLSLEILDCEAKSVGIYGQTTTIKVTDKSELGTITIGKDATSSQITVEKDSKASKIVTAGESTKIAINGKVTDIDVNEYGDKTNITINSNSTVSTIDIDAEDIKVSGSGKVTRINVNEDDAEINVKSAKVCVHKDADGTKVNNKSVKSGSTVNSSNVDDEDEDWDDDEWDDVEISSIEVEDENTVIVTLNEKLPSKLSKSDFEIERVGSGSDPSIRSYDYVSSGSRKYKEYTLTTSDLEHGDRYELMIELPNGRDISKRFYANYDEDKDDDKDYDYPTISNVSTKRDTDTTATLNWKANNSGKLYYLVKAENESATVQDVKNSGQYVNISSGTSNVRISGLEAGKSYKVYVVTYNNYNSSLYGPYTIEAGTGSTNNPSTDTTKYAVDSLQNINGTTSFEFELNKAVALTKDKIELKHSSNGLIVINNITTSNNTKYRVDTSETALVDGTYTLKVTFPNGAIYSKEIILDVGLPEISNISMKKEGSNYAEVKLTASKDGYVYYILGDKYEESASEIRKLGTRIRVNSGENIIGMTIDKNANKNYVSMIITTYSDDRLDTVYKVEV